ncbi:hypothetical protein ANCDUO_24869, partial [Ancylostoma duodenale]
MIFLLLLCACASLCVVKSDNRTKININEPLTVTISPKLWNLLETKSNIINEAVTSITFPEFSGKKSLVKYRVWEGKVEHFAVPKSGVSFLDMSNGVHLSLIEAIDRKVNPRLQILKQKMISMGYTEYDIEWTIQNNILRVTVKPKSRNGVVSPVQPIDTMLCVNADVLEVMDIVSKRTKRSA